MKEFHQWENVRAGNLVLTCKVDLKIKSMDQI